MSDEPPLSLNDSVKRPRTLSTPSSDKDQLLRPFSREASVLQEKKGEAMFVRDRPSPGIQYHNFRAAQPKTEIAQASGVPHYLVPYSWYQKFITYVKDGNGIPPPELALEELDRFLESGSDPKNGRDIQVLQVEQWSMIQAWYGHEDEQCVRHTYKARDGSFVVEYRPTTFYFSLYTPPSAFSDLKDISMYKYKDVEGLYEKVRHAFGINASHQIRFWHTTDSAGLSSLNNAKEAITKTYERVNIGTVTGGSTLFIVETRANAAEKWQLEICKQAQIARARPQGTKGLINLGNTCYMASALQCLVHVQELSNYFLSGCYTTELNMTNPLGYGGKVATAFARLLSQLYADDNQKAVAPRELKTILGNINQSFGGYQQQDSQELLAFLLDALHEDLNRIIKKPATQRPDIGDVSTEELLKLGEEAWRIHKLRNDSVIVDLFQGIYKSTLVCPICAHVSITFDPFSDLSLPLPFRSYWTHDIHYIPLDGPLIKITVEFEQNASIGQILAYLSKRYGVKTTMLAGAEVWKHKFYKLYESYMPVTTIEKSDDAYFYELDDVDPRTQKDSSSICIPVYTNIQGRHQDKAHEGAIPFPIILSEAETKSFAMIQQKVLKCCARFTTSNDLLPSETTIIGQAELESADNVVHPVKQDPCPFLLKVGPHKIGTAFYGGREPTLLQDRIMQDRVIRSYSPSQDLGESGNSSPLPVDILPPYDDSDSPMAPIVGDLEKSRLVPQYDGIQGGPITQVVRIVDSDDEDAGMQDASDDERQARPHTNGDIVSKLLAEQEHISGQRTPISNAASTPPDGRDSRAPPALSDTFMQGMPEDIALLTDKDAIYCEWPEDVYEEIYSSTPDTLGGQALWNNFEQQRDVEMDEKRTLREGSKHNSKSLEDCLDEFAKEEPLDAENTWYCPKCKEHQRANKTFELWRSGDILVFHLKRFSSSRSLADKIDAEIEFPIRGLNLNERLGERRLKIEKGVDDVRDSIYDLTGVVNHYGGLGGGHYTAFAQTFSEDGQQDFHNFNGMQSIDMSG